MKIFVCVCALLLSSCAPAQEPERVFKLGNIGFDPENCILTWSVQDGVLKDNQFVLKVTVYYKIDLHKGIMSKNGEEARPFSMDEADQMHEIINQVLTRYVMESTYWWINPPKEEPANPDTKPSPVSLVSMRKK